MISTSTDRRAAALALARAKLPVLPLYGPSEGTDNQRGKMPRQKGWQDTHNSAEAIAQWFDRHPDSNVGLVTGAASGLVCIDVDPRNGGGDWLKQHAPRLKAEGAAVERTGSGGFHLWFVHPGGFVASKRGKVGIAPGVELLADGGHQAVVAPSVHKTGGVYTWTSSIPLAELLDYGSALPEWIATSTLDAQPRRSRSRAESYADRAQDISRFQSHLAATPGAVEGQGGNLHTFKLAAYARELGISPEQCWPLLCEWNETCTPPWSHDELRQVMTNGYAYAKAPEAGSASAAQQFAAIDVAPPAALSPEAAKQQEDELIPWTDRAVKAKGGVWKSHVRNAQLVLTNMPELSQSFRFNEFTHGTEVLRGRTPWRGWPGTPEWTDDDAVALAQWIAEHVPGLPALDPAVIHAAVRPFARLTRYHPVRDYLDALTWDKKPRLRDWTARYLGAAATEYHAAVGERFLIGAVARIYQPGCKLDTMLVLEGAQGTFKSSALRTLFGSQWFTDAALDVSNKDAASIIRGHWGIEFGEMHTAKRAEVTELKAFLSRQEDRQRDAYARSAETHARQCVFAGTTNSAEYLRDETGGRRFWPVVCGRVVLGALAADRDQLWAEAETRFAAGERWWLLEQEEELARAEQAKRLVHDEWIDVIAAWLEANVENDVSHISRCTGLQVWSGALGGSPVTLLRPVQMRIADCMRALGFEPTTWRDVKRVVRGYSRVKTSVTSVGNRYASDEL